MSTTLSRRSLLTGVAAGTATLVASASVARAADSTAPSWDQTADVVVVGLGCAGATAAVSALEAGATVTVLESETQGGGSTNICGGLIYLGGGTKTQKDAGVEDTVDDMRAYLLAAMGPSADPDMVDVLCENSVATYDWLVDHGITFEGTADITSHVVTAPQGVVLTYSGNERADQYATIARPAPRGHTPNGGGAAIMAALTALIDASPNGTILYETRGTELITDEAGAVIGVRAQDADGKDVLVKATKGVVLSAGAFTYNDEMLADYAPEVLGHTTRTGVPSDRGDGILMGMRVGAATHSMSRTGMWEFLYLYGDMAAGVMLDRTGRRFLSEDWYGSWIGRIATQYSPDTCWVIVDDVMLQGILDTPYGSFMQPAYTADTLSELVAQLDVPTDNALDSIERYNAQCAAGKDADFGKSVDYLRPIETAPFHAFDARPSVMASPLTLGGLKINTSAEVLSLDGEPIPGLYAAGRTASGVFGEYPGSGTSVADCVVFGRIAGEKAAARS